MCFVRFGAGRSCCASTARHARVVDWEKDIYRGKYADVTDEAELKKKEQELKRKEGARVGRADATLPGAPTRSVPVSATRTRPPGYMRCHRRRRPRPAVRALRSRQRSEAAPAECACVPGCCALCSGSEAAGNAAESTTGCQRRRWCGATPPARVWCRTTDICSAVRSRCRRDPVVHTAMAPIALAQAPGKLRSPTPTR
jgi:hypothetical protein